MMKKSNAAFRCLAAFMFAASGGAHAGDLNITSFGDNGELVFNEIANAVSYRVECAPSPAGPWAASDVSLTNIAPSGSGNVTCSVTRSAGSLFYRVVAEGDFPPAMVLIPAGVNSGTDPDYGAYSLTVDEFYMDKYEVTNDEMVRIMQWAYDNGRLIVSSASVQNAQGSQQELLDLDDSDCRITWSGSAFGVKSTKGAGYPCVEITWYGAAAYCNYRSEMDGRTPCYDLTDWSCNFAASGYRLPANGEWEYAARGGLSGKRFPWGDTINHNNANYKAYGSAFSYDTSPYTVDTYHPDHDDGGFPYTSPVGDFAPNGYGLYDMAGNVWEWCNDGSESIRGFRGGSWNYRAYGLRCGYEFVLIPGDGASDRGFRAVCR